jgi:hypothetical protein
LGFRVWGMGLGLKLELGALHGLCVWSRVQGLQFMVHGLWFRV